MPPNPFLLAADNSPVLLPLLREHPSLASQQDEHGYSLVHAAASYGHLDLLRTLINELNVPVDLRDEDRETALFVVETVEAARCLVEELKMDASIRGADGLTAQEKIAGEGDFPLVADYLRALETKGANGASAGGSANGTDDTTPTEIPPLPEGLSVNVGTMAEPEDEAEALDPELRRRIAELAARDDFHTAQGQAELRRLVEDVVVDEGLTEDRNVRPREG